MAKFYIAGCFADNIIVDKDADKIEKEDGGPAHFITTALDKLEEEYEVAKGKRGIVEIHVQNGKETGRFPLACKLSHAPITSEIVLAYAISNELSLDNLKGGYKEIYMDGKGFVRDPENFGERRECGIKNVDRVKVLKTTRCGMEFLPENLLAHVREKGVLIITEPKLVTILEKGSETKIEVNAIGARDAIGLEETFFAAFSSHYSKTKDAKTSVESAIVHARDFMDTRRKVADEE